MLKALFSSRVPSGDVLRSHPLWLGLLMCTATFTYAHEHGCQIAELLAINDDGNTTAIGLIVGCSLDLQSIRRDVWFDHTVILDFGLYE